MIQCDADNPLICPEHAILLDFQTVPQLIMERLTHLGNLHEEYLYLSAALENAALLEGVLPTQIGQVAYHHPDGRVALRTLLHTTMEAELDFSSERERQYRQALEYVQVQLHHHLGHLPEDERFMLANLVCLRFLIVEQEHPGADSETHYEEIFAMTRPELLAPLADPQVKAMVTACDRAFLTCTTGVIPDGEDLVSLAYERILRRSQMPTLKDSSRALALIERLFSRSPQT